MYIHPYKTIFPIRIITIPFADGRIIIRRNNNTSILRISNLNVHDKGYYKCEAYVPTMEGQNSVASETLLMIKFTPGVCL